MAFSVPVLAKGQGGAGWHRAWQVGVSVALRKAAWWNVGVSTRSKVELGLGKGRACGNVVEFPHGWIMNPTPMLSTASEQNLKVCVANTWRGIYPSKCPASKCGAKGYQGTVKEGSPQSHGQFLFSHREGRKESVGIIWYFHIFQSRKFQVIAQIKTTEQVTTKLHLDLSSSLLSVQRED